MERVIVVVPPLAPVPLEQPTRRAVAAPRAATVASDRLQRRGVAVLNIDYLQ
jgi:hypothetical protein